VVEPLAPRPSRARRASRSGARLPGTARRAAILEAALPVFATRGLAGTGTRDLARAAGVTEPVLYRHFPSKTDLFLAVLAAAEAAILERLRASVEARGGSPRGRAGDRVRALAASLDALLSGASLELSVLHGAAATRTEDRVTAAVRGTYSRLGAALASMLRGPGLARGVSARLAGAFLLEVGVGASLLGSIRLPDLERKGYGAAVERMLLAALT
jgi:AcrR family transcriptional regulator